MFKILFIGQESVTLGKIFYNINVIGMELSWS
jgi:hypothetical protein